MVKTRQADRSRADRHRRSGFDGLVLCAEEAEVFEIAETISLRLRRDTRRTVRPGAVKPRGGATARWLWPTRKGRISLPSQKTKLALRIKWDMPRMARRRLLGTHGEVPVRSKPSQVPAPDHLS